MRRRDFMIAGGTLVAGAALHARAQEVQDIRPLIERVTGGAALEKGGVEVGLPAIAENGNSVPLKIKVQSPMSAEDHVTAVHVFAERNPRPHVATFHFGPQSGRAEITTRVRLAGTQKLTVLAALTDNRFRIAQVDVLVTTAACLDESAL